MFFVVFFKNSDRGIYNINITFILSYEKKNFQENIQLEVSVINQTTDSYIILKWKTIIKIIFTL